MNKQIGRAAEAGTVTWWLNATLARTVALDDALTHLRGTVRDADGSERNWTSIVGALRANGTSRLRLALVEPGDPGGLPGPAHLSRAAVAAGAAIVSDEAAVVLVAGDPWQLMPAVRAAGAPNVTGSLPESRRILREAMHSLTLALPGLDPDDQALAELADLRAFPGPPPPPGIPPRAAAVAVDALRVWWMAIVASELCQRRGLTPPVGIRELSPAARRAASTAFSQAPDRPG